nr:S8 family serine peptidase [Lysinibacillus timonensis]
MKKMMILTILSSLFISSVAPMVHARAEAPKENVIIIFKDDIDQRAVQNVNGEIEQVLDNMPVVTGEVPKNAIDDLERDKDVLAVEVDQRIHINGQLQDWGIQAVKAPTAWESEFTGKGVKIAVLDTGIAPHNDLEIAGGVSFTSYTPSYIDDNGHGTHVAGIIGAENNDIGVVGVAPDADVYAVKVLDRNGSGNLSDIIKGIDWAITNNMDIINLSLGTQVDSLALKQTVDKAYNKGILVVAAAGNDGNSEGIGETVDYPARYDSVIAVSATDSSNIRGAFSSTGAEVEVAGPGMKILSTFLSNQYAYMNGTSMAAPFVAGNLALLKQANSTSTHIQLRKKLKETVIDIGVSGKDSFYGYGLVQAPVKVTETVVKNDSIETEEQVNEQPLTQAPNLIQPTQTGEAPTSETEETMPAPQPILEPAPKLAPIQETTPKTEPNRAPLATQPKPVTQPIKKPIAIQPKPSTLKSMTATLKTSKITYKAGSYVYVYLKAIDKSTKKPVVNGTVKVTIKSPTGQSSVMTVKTNSKGEAIVKWKSSKYAKKGIYKLSMSASASRYKTESTAKTIRIY